MQQNIIIIIIIITIIITIVPSRKPKEKKKKNSFTAFQCMEEPSSYRPTIVFVVIVIMISVPENMMPYCKCQKEAV